MPLGRHTGPDAIRHPARSPRPGLCNPYRIEFCLGSVTRGSHVPWQPRARICKSFRLVPAPNVFCQSQACSSHERILRSRAEFRFPPGLDDRFPQTSPRPTVVQVTKHQAGP
jgi:hypothetical protein